MDTSSKLALVAATSLAGAALIAGLASSAPAPFAAIDATPSSRAKPQTVFGDAEKGCPSASVNSDVTFCVHG